MKYFFFRVQQSWLMSHMLIIGSSSKHQPTEYALFRAEILFDWKAIRNQAHLVWSRYDLDIRDTPNDTHSRGEQNTMILHCVPISTHLLNSRKICIHIWYIYIYHRATVAEIACVFIITSKRGRRTESIENRKIVTTSDVHRSEKCICRRQWHMT